MHTSNGLDAARAELAPTGVLQVALNHSNFLLVKKGSSATAPEGIASDVARALADSLGVPVEFSAYDTPGQMADAVTTGAWKVALLAAEPARAADIAFSAAYLEIEASYLVPEGSPLQTMADVDQPGKRISVVARSAYDLWLQRNIQHAELVPSTTADEGFAMFVQQGMDALSGLRPRLVLDADKLPGSRILEGRFTAVQQAIGVPRACAAGAAYVRGFVEDIKRSGFVASLIERHGVRGVNVAGPAA
jgi:polar amino acid transport system substrate-binding protein